MKWFAPRDAGRTSCVAVPPAGYGKGRLIVNGFVDYDYDCHPPTAIVDAFISPPLTPSHPFTPSFSLLSLLSLPPPAHLLQERAALAKMRGFTARREEVFARAKGESGADVFTLFQMYASRGEDRCGPRARAVCRLAAYAGAGGCEFAAAARACGDGYQQAAAASAAHRHSRILYDLSRGGQVRLEPARPVYGAVGADRHPSAGHAGHQTAGALSRHAAHAVAARGRGGVASGGFRVGAALFGRETAGDALGDRWRGGRRRTGGLPLPDQRRERV